MDALFWIDVESLHYTRERLRVGWRYTCSLDAGLIDELGDAIIVEGTGSSPFEAFNVAITKALEEANR